MVSQRSWLNVLVSNFCYNPYQSISQKDKNLDLKSKEIVILRDLAKRVAEIAALPEQDIKRKLWYQHNALKSEKVMVLCFPENGWAELLPDSVLQTKDPLFREMENNLRMNIYMHEHIHDDNVLDNFYDLNYVYERSDYGLTMKKIKSTMETGSYTWEAPLKDLEDIEKLKPCTITIDQAKTKERIELAQEVFGDILKVRLKGGFFWGVGLTWKLIDLRGLEQVMIDLSENSEWLHRVMQFLQKNMMQELNFYEKNNLLSLNNDNDYVGSGGLGFTHELPQDDFNGRVRLKDMWGFAEAQPLTGVSPRMLDEFSLQYELPLLARFGLNCYGCCEPLDKKYSLVKKVPNLRRVSVSPFADVEIAARELQDKYIFSWKPSPTDMANPHFDERKIREYIQRTLDIAKGCVLEIVLKDLTTVNHDPSRIDRWTSIAKELTKG